MIETIGNVKLYMDLYPGEDLYSDGAVEDELLEIAKSFAPEDFDRVVAERRSWPVMYHFSSIRKQILDWYPDLTGKRILEIGSGCGAVTAALAERAGSVTCVELSKKRSLINAWRNRQYANIEIRLGNFEDVEKLLPADYDVITLIGVFEYGVNYIHSEEPYRDFLLAVKRHLRPGGAVLIAIENRFGMKYFAGCTEDHTGGFFDGIEGYTDTSYVRTFTKPELERIAGSAGFTRQDFYYPYPDYKFPFSLYSDAYLPRQGDLRSNIVNFDRRRLILFDESKAYDALEGSGLYPLYANSFLAVLHGEEESGEERAGESAAGRSRIVFEKYSTERSATMAIRTEIRETEEGLSVRKLPASGRAGNHVRGMEKSYELLSGLFAGTRFVPNRMHMEGEAAVFDYISGRTLEEVCDREGLSNPVRLKELLFSVLSELDRMAAPGSFSPTPAFAAVFGRADLPDGLAALPCADVDMVLNNLLLSGERWHVIDYEWTFAFPVPLHFLKWRILHYYIEGNTKRFFLREAGLFEEAGLTAEEIAAYEEMERHFQSYTRGEWTPLRELYADISEGAADLPYLLRRMGERRGGKAEARLYLDTGAGFHEEETVRVPHAEDGSISITQPLTLEGGRRVLRIRMDPAEYAGYVKLEELGSELGALDPAGVSANGVRLDLRRWLFDTNDPYLIAEGWPDDAKYFYARLTMTSMDVDSAEFMRQELDRRDRRILELESAGRDKEQLLSWRGDVIRQLMKTKPMKAYRKLRVKAKREDPYAMLRPLLPSDPEGILYCIDHVSNRRDGFFLRGWCFDRSYERERVLVVNSHDREVPAVITRYRRPDVAARFGLPEERELGFTVEIPYETAEALPLYLEVENPRGYTCEQLPVEPDSRKREEVNALLRDRESASHEITGYEEWALEHAATPARLAAQRAEGAEGPLFSVLVPLYRTRPELLSALVDSVLCQSYERWELILSDGSGEPSPLTAILREYAQRDARIRPVFGDHPMRIAENTNAAYRAARGEWLVFADHDDLLAPDALYEVARVIREHPDAEFIYTDEDKLLPGDVPGQPHFKPDFSPELLTSVNYICHLTAVSRQLAERAGGADGGPLDPAFDGAQDYDFVLRCTENTKGIYHIPRILYHWRMTEESTAADPAAKEYAFAAGARAINAHYERLGIPADVTRGKHAGLYRTRYHYTEEPLVSIIIANKDHLEDLTRCISSIEEKSSYRRFEILIVENNSTEQETFAGYRDLEKKYGQIRTVRYEGAFNYSAINNLGAREARGEYLLFLNNDTELIAGDALRIMVSSCMRPGIGAVGARLFFEDGSVQHAGVILGYGEVAGHAFREFGPDETGYQHRILLQQNYSAVTAACMLVKREAFEQAGGFFEGLAVAFNDIDLCMQLREKGYRIVYEPDAVFYHYESKSRGYEDTPEKQARFTGEVRIFKERWPGRIEAGDPYYNPNLTLRKPDFTLKSADEYNQKER